MRVPTTSILLTGAIIALGACSTSGETVNLTQAQRAEVCRGAARAEITPTGRQTGEVRHDYECRSVHGGVGYLDRRDRNIPNRETGRARAINRAFGGM